MEMILIKIMLWMMLICLGCALLLVVPIIILSIVNYIEGKRNESD